jgi:hypothetical protein
VATCHPLRRSAVRANSRTTGIAEGNIIAAIITTQVAAKAPIGPRPMSIPVMAREWWTMAPQATPEAARTTSAAAMGLASSTSSQGRLRRSRLSWSRSWVNSFSREVLLFERSFYAFSTWVFQSP